MQTFQLKRPTGVYLLATLFLLAPFGNIIINFRSLSSHMGSMDFLTFLGSISALDWGVLVLTFITGLLLFRPHKTSWSIAIGTLLLVLFLNTYRWSQSDAQGALEIDTLQLTASCLSTFFILLIAFYFRFPYLDRRARWFSSAAHRHDVSWPVQVYSKEVLEGETESVSITGMRIRLKGTPMSLESQLVTIQIPNFDGQGIKSQVVEQKNSTLMVKFLKLEKQTEELLIEKLRGSSAK